MKTKNSKIKKDQITISKRTIFLIIYGFIILLILIAIMFIIPDDFFLSKYNNITLSETTTENIEFTDYETQKEHILNKNFSYEYLILDSMGTQSYEYTCSGQITGTLESGTCTKPEEFSYTEQTKEENFKINTDYFDVTYIFSLIENIEPTLTQYTSQREYVYTITLTDLETEITIYTDTDEITRIDISNAYMTYVLKYTNMSY